MSSAEENKTLVRRFFVAQARGDMDVIDELLSPDFVDRSLLPGQEPDREAYKREVAKDQATFSNLRYIVEDQLADGDKVVSRVTVRLTHDRREYEGFAPTGKEYEVPHIYIHRIVGGKLAEEWSEGRGILELMEQRLEQEMIERQRIEQELKVARLIQQALLPKGAPELAGWEIAQYYRPAREVGGDFYDFFELDSGRLGLVIGDVSGKGIPAALVMAGTRSVLRAVAQRGASAPGRALAEANEVLCPDVPANMFITCFYGVLDPKSGRLVYANAGHNLPYCRRQDGLTEELQARGMPLGLMPGMSYEENETTLGPRECVLFYSDGLVEAHDPKGEMFGSLRLKGLVAKDPTGGKGLTAFLLEKLERFVGGGAEQEDDITLVTLVRPATCN
jgi:serine phosphatase RsbU (regulator of sigma subunit)/ketosteroid isomerase-like protein